MAPEIIVGLLSFCGTTVGTLAGVITSSRLTNYRIEQLESQVKKHNNLIDRVYNLEKDNAIQDELIKEIEEKIKREEEKP